MSAEIPPKPARTARRIAIDLSVMTLIGVLMAIVGPFGSFELPFAVRLLYWLALGYVGYAVYSPMGVAVDRLHRRLDLPRGWLWVAACLVATIPMATIVYVMNYLPGPVPVPSAEAALWQYAYVLVIGGAITLLFVALDRRAPPVAGSITPAAQSDLPPAPTSLSPARLADRLPAALGADILAVENEDHYVRVHTALGSELLLMRLADAIAELAGLDGMQVHRGWWVARHAVENVRRDGRNLRLVLEGGIEAPVSRAKVQSLKDAGWL